MSRPFAVGQKVRCIRASEAGIPITEGETYTVSRTFRGNQQPHEATVPGMGSTAGVCVEGIGGFFTADRFEEVA